MADMMTGEASTDYAHHYVLVTPKEPRASTAKVVSRTAIIR
jgi:hypothetical protein